MQQLSCYIHHKAIHKKKARTKNQWYFGGMRRCEAISLRAIKRHIIYAPEIQFGGRVNYQSAANEQWIISICRI